MTPREFALKRLETEEGFSAHTYQDHLGLDTIGYGTLLPLSIEETLHLRCGDRPQELRERDCAWLLQHRAGEAFDRLERDLAWFRDLPASVQAALYDLVYNLGQSRLLRFRRMIAALEEDRWEVAAVELFDSRYATQVPKRAERNRWLILQAGALPESVQALYAKAEEKFDPYC